MTTNVATYIAATFGAAISYIRRFYRLRCDVCNGVAPLLNEVRNTQGISFCWCDIEVTGEA